jgi:hypothetical protein
MHQARQRGDYSPEDALDAAILFMTAIFMTAIKLPVGEEPDAPLTPQGAQDFRKAAEGVQKRMLDFAGVKSS